MQRHQQLRRSPGPVRQGRAIEHDAAAGVHLGLAIKRRVVRVLGHHHVGDGGFGRQPALDQARRRRGLHHHFLAGAAAVLGPADHQGAEGRRDHVQPLGDVFADPVQGARAAGTGLVVDVDHLLDARQMGRRVLELQAGPHHFLASLNGKHAGAISFSPGSLLELTGVYSSAPEDLVETLVAAIAARFDARVEEVRVVKEDVTFKLPRVLAG